ncbi:hypothetical protein ESCO_000678 [Escovopsis weberi]|uniref:CFEM domain-containing protein n=1 Tax=Escovopsis weberi TaxID=150374 RepID=A0A0M9VTI9_ESCWE|nr:hypothetical protein ESCO_000678 [Escovopsis weberi]
MKSALVIISALGMALAQFPGVPKCAIDCLIPIIPISGCTEKDIPCLCRNVGKLQDAIVPCVLKACKPDEIQKAKEVMVEKCK